MKCPNCRNEISLNDEKCSSCGTKYSTAFAKQYSVKPTIAPPTPKQKSSYDNVYATLGLIFSLIGSPIIGIILGIIGCNKSEEHCGKGKTASILAIIIGIISVIIFINNLQKLITAYKDLMAILATL